MRRELMYYPEEEEEREINLLEILQAQMDNYRLCGSCRFFHRSLRF